MSVRRRDEQAWGAAADLRREHTGLRIEMLYGLADITSILLQGGLQKALGGRLSERGVLQLLFDLQLLRAALAGGRPASAGRDSPSQLRCVDGRISVCGKDALG